MCALPAWGPLLNVELVHKIDGFLKRSFRYGFRNKLITIPHLLDSATEDLFCKMKTSNSNHCLHPLLPPDRTLNQVLRTRGHTFQLPTCSFNLHKKSFLISCLFKFLTWLYSCFFSFLDCFFFKCFTNFRLSRLTFSFNFCPLLLLITNYCDIYKPITACTFVAAIQ